MNETFTLHQQTDAAIAAALSRLRIADAVAEEFAASELDLLERIAWLEADVDAYRELAQMGIHRIAELNTELQAKQRQLTALREEFAEFRAHVMRQAAGAAA